MQWLKLKTLSLNIIASKSTRIFKCTDLLCIIVNWLVWWWCACFSVCVIYGFEKHWCVSLSGRCLCSARIPWGEKTVPECVGDDLDRLQCLLEGSKSNRWDVEWLKSFVTTVDDLLHCVDHSLEPLMQYVSILSMAEQWTFTSRVGNWRKFSDLDSMNDIAEWLNSFLALLWESPPSRNSISKTLQ